MANMKRLAEDAGLFEKKEIETAESLLMEAYDIMTDRLDLSGETGILTDKIEKLLSITFE